MKKSIKKIIIILLVIISIIILKKWIFSFQYNKNGISHFLTITIDENKEKEYIGNLNNHKVYVEKLDLKGTNFRTINAEDISIKEVIEKNLVSIDEWKKYARNTRTEDDSLIFQFENYEIVVTNDECIIKPLSK